MLKEVQVCLKRLDVVGGKSFLQKQGDTGLVKLCSKNLVLSYVRKDHVVIHVWKVVILQVCIRCVREPHT